MLSDVPLRGSTSRFESWRFDRGGFSRSGERRVDNRERRIVDLEDIDARALMQNVNRATERLGVDDGEVSHVIVS